MQTKSRNWTDVQLIVASISVAVTLGFWGLLASREKSVARAAGTESPPPQTDTPTSTPAMLLPGQTLILAGAMPVATSPVAAQTQPKRRRGGDGGGGGGGTGSS